MKFSRSDVQCKTHVIPELKFEGQSLTSFAGLVLFQQLLAVLDLKARLRGCFRHLKTGKVFGRATIFLQLIVHILLRFRKLPDSRACHDDPLVKRVLGLARVTLDFDGSVQSTRRFAEATAVGYNKREKGARSYYPLFCTIAQIGQVLDGLHRPGNVHDSKGA